MKEVIQEKSLYRLSEELLPLRLPEFKEIIIPLLGFKGAEPL